MGWKVPPISDALRSFAPKRGQSEGEEQAVSSTHAPEGPQRCHKVRAKNMLLVKPLDDLSESDLDQLVLDGTAECKTIEYKLMLPGKSEGDTKEFLADASSFANSAGGYLIYGIKAVNGQPVELCGLPENSTGDAEILRLESSIRTGINPRMPGVHSKAVPLGSGKVVLIIRIPRSYAAPHMVTYKGSSRFFSRSSNGKYQLDVGEIRTAFLLSESASERCRDFRLDRLSRIQGNDTPVPMEEGAKVVLHIAPIGATSQPAALAADVADKLRRAFLLCPIYDTGFNPGYNFDGIFTYSPGETAGLAGSYLQVFRSGYIETVNHRILRHKVIPSETFEKGVIESLPNYFEALKVLNIDPPVFVMLSLVGVSGFRMAPSNSEYSKKIDRDTLVCPGILIESFGSNVEGQIKPALDTVWNAVGWPESPNYHGSQWAPDRR